MMGPSEGSVGACWTRFRVMASESSVEVRDPDLRVTVKNPAVGVVYLMPSASGMDGRPAYMGSDALLAKRALAAGLPVEYALTEDERQFVEHFSAQLDVIGLYIAVVNLVPSMIQGIHALIELAAMRRGYTEESAKKASVDLRIDYLNTPTTEARGVRIKGDADSVVAAVRELTQGHDAPRTSDD